MEILKHNGVTPEKLCELLPEYGRISERARRRLEIEGKYKGYLERQRSDIAAFRRDENIRIPDHIDYRGTGFLNAELIEKLIATRPATLGAAKRIEGMDPAAIVQLLHYMKRTVNVEATPE
jgi:tRNA uridine 5-carboxymethylaminomethyl modification enzyme